MGPLPGFSCRSLERRTGIMKSKIKSRTRSGRNAENIMVADATVNYYKRSEPVNELDDGVVNYQEQLMTLGDEMLTKIAQHLGVSSSRDLDESALFFVSKKAMTIGQHKYHTLSHHSNKKQCADNVVVATDTPFVYKYAKVLNIFNYRSKTLVLVYFYQNISFDAISIPYCNITEKSQSDMMKNSVVIDTSSSVCPFGLLNYLNDGIIYFIWSQMRRALVKIDSESDVFTMNFNI
ncbi:hypothetical protein EDC94DRAFT_661955 [Helicostylum pulchrum]|nr:hypothetical protein EDC94DRAFT_661955 [Helicostylum pulchrum]